MPIFPSFLSRFRRFSSLWLALATCILASVALWSYHARQTQRRAEARARWERVLNVNLDLLSGTIQYWLDERRGDAEVFSGLARAHSVVFRGQRYQTGHAPDGTAQEQLEDALEAIHSSFQYTGAWLFDTAGRVMITTPAASAPSAEERAVSAAAIRGMTALQLERTVSPANETPHLDIIVGIPVVKTNVKGNGQETLGAFVLAVDPLVSLLPAIARRPTDARTTITSLVLLTGDSIVSMTPSTTRKYPVVRKWLASTAPLLERYAVGLDSTRASGTEVNTATMGGARQISGSTLGLVQRTQWEEVYANADRGLHVEAGLVLLGLVGLASALYAMAWRARGAQMRVETELYKSEQRYRLLFDHNPQPMWVFDAETLRFLAVNDAAIEHYGFSRDEFLAMTLKDIRSPEAVPALLEGVSNLDSAQRAGTHHQHRKRDGTLIDVEITSDWTSFADRPARLVVATDVTERHRLAMQLQQAQKMEAVGQLAGGVAHDFNNLLTVILAHCDFLREDLPECAPQRADVDEVHAAAQRATALTSQLLAFSRKQLLKPRVVDLNTTISGLERMLVRLIGEDIRVRTVLAPHLGAVFADPGQVEQVLMNLVVNARDAMPNGGALTLKTTPCSVPEHGSVHDTVPAGEYVMVSVQDTGLGMDDDTKARIFEPFFTTKEPGKGTGLGLSTVYGIVKQSDGYICVDSAPGRGTTFRIYLPRHAVVADACPAVPQEGAPVHTAATVLLVEDEDGVRRLTRRILESNGYRVLAAAHGREAIEIAKTHVGEITLVVTDLVMPGVSGRALAEALTEIRPGVRVLYMSGYTDDEIVRRGLLDPAMSFLEKPFTTARFLSAVQQTLRAA